MHKALISSFQAWFDYVSDETARMWFSIMFVVSKGRPAQEFCLLKHLCEETFFTLSQMLQFNSTTFLKTRTILPRYLRQERNACWLAELVQFETITMKMAVNSNEKVLK